jgi:hypothetical protein
MTDDLETGICPACEQKIPADRLQLHLDGLDGARPECPRQDIERIAPLTRVIEREFSLWGRRVRRRG